MNKENYYYLGKITRLFGFKGEVVVFLDVDDMNDYLELDSFYVEVKKELIPYFIVSKTVKNNTIIVKLEDIENEGQATKLVNCNLYLPLQNLPKLSGKNFYYHEITGYSVVDKHAGNIGFIDKVLDYPHQDVFSIIFEHKEILIPVRDEIIMDLDRKNKILYIDAPEGLIELYLE